MSVQHPVAVGTDVLFDNSDCGCGMKPLQGKVTSFSKRGFAYWYMINNSKQIHQKRILRLI